MPHRQDSKEDWMDVLGVILGIFERTRDLLGEGLGFNLGSKPLRSYTVWSMKLFPRRRRHAIILASALNLLHKEVTKCDLQL
jgi:hypothetical protein